MVRPLLRRVDQWCLVALMVICMTVMLTHLACLQTNGSRLIDVERQSFAPPGFEVRVNSAPWPELTLLPGIGETLARRIVEQRSLRPFSDADDLRRVKGIGPKTVQRMQPYLSFD